MVFLTDQECTEWFGEHEIEIGHGIGDKSPVLRVDLNVGASTIFPVSRLIQDGVGPWNNCLLWVTLADVWPSSTNLHLYYAVRRSYGDNRLLPQAPGHLFLNYEQADLTTFLHMGLLSGWDLHVVTDLGYGRAFASHDGWVELWRSDGKDLRQSEDAFRQVGCGSTVQRA